MTRSLLLLTSLFLLTGCGGQMTGYMEALGKDPASACVSVSTPYGTGLIGRANSPGVRVSISGGQCTIESTAK